VAADLVGVGVAALSVAAASGSTTPHAEEVGLNLPGSAVGAAIAVDPSIAFLVHIVVPEEPRARI